MLKFSHFFVIIGTLLLYAPLTFGQQVIVQDDFEDENLSENPEWTGTTGKYIFVEESGNKLLRLNDTEAAGTANRAQLRTKSDIAYGIWEFYYRQDAAPSNTNRSFIFLVSDIENINYLTPDESPVNGYAIRTGDNTAERKFRLVRFSNGNQTVLAETGTIVQEAQGYQLKVTRSNDGDWQIYIGEGYGSEPVADSPVVNDNNHTESNWFGLLSSFSSGNFDKFFFDDIRISSHDNFEISSVTALNLNSINATFNFPVKESSIAPADFSLSGIGNPNSVSPSSDKTVQLTFEDDIPNAEYTLTVSNVDNIYGGTIAENSELTFNFENPFKIDGISVTNNHTLVVTFTENVDSESVATTAFSVNNDIGQPNSASLTADKQVALTFNTAIADGNYSLNATALKSDTGWNIPANSDIAFEISIPFSTDELTATNNRTFVLSFTQDVDEATVLAANFSLGDAGQPSSVSLSENNQVTLSWNAALSDGDYTLTVNNVKSESAWTITPNTEAEITLENPFVIESFEAVSNNQFAITFAENVDETSIVTENLSINKEVGQPQTAVLSEGKIITITYPENLSSGGFTLTVSTLTSENGWVLAQNTTRDFSLFDVYADGDVVINEFWYRGGSVRYVEILNKTEKRLNLGDWELRRRTDAPSNGGVMRAGELVLEPGAFLVITPSATDMQNQFGSRNYTQMSGYPGFTQTTADTIRLITPEGDLADSVPYNPSTWGGNGVALERISANAISFAQENWAESTDPLGGSPTLANTQQAPSDAPTVEEVTTTLPGIVDVKFSRSLSEESLNDPQNFQLDGGITVTEAKFTDNTRIIRLTLNQNLKDGQAYTITISSAVTDLFGNAMADNFEFEFDFENPFRIKTAEITSANQLKITFTQSLQINSVQTTDFRLAENTQPSTLSFPESDKVLLTFPDNFPDGSSTVFVSTIESISGWTIEENSEFKFFLFGVYEPGDIIVNEFMYRPPSGYVQYIELHNTSGKLLNLQDWEIRRRDGATNNGGAFSANKQLVFEPGAYLVISADTSALRSVFGSRPYYQMSNYPGFPTTVADEIRLFDPDGTLRENIPYETSWGGNGVALERLSAEVASNIQDNWEESQDPLLGSPGLENTVDAPQEAPAFVTAAIEKPQRVDVLFSRALSDNSIAELSNFSISGDAQITGITRATNARRLYFEVDRLLDDNTNYTLTMSGVEDFFGNQTTGEVNFEFLYRNPFRIESATIVGGNQLNLLFTQTVDAATVQASDFSIQPDINAISVSFPASNRVLVTFAENFTSGSSILEVSGIESVPGWTIESNTQFTFFLYDEFEDGDVLISEFMYNAPSGYARYVEVFNTTDKHLNLRNWELRRAAGASSGGGTISSNNITLMPGGYLVITPDSTSLFNIFGTRPYVQMSGFPGFTTASPSQIRLINNNGNTVDSLQYTPSEWGGNGVALERRSFAALARFRDNWGDSESALLGTPGAANTVSPPAEPPTFTYAEYSESNKIIIRFNRAINPDVRTETARYSVSGGAAIESVTYNSNTEAVITLTENMTSGEMYTVTINNLPDIFGNEISGAQREFRFWLIEDVAPGDVFISEFMYNEPDDYSRYIELYNRSGKALDIAGWRQANDTGTRRTLTTNRHILPPDSFIVILPNTDLLTFFPDINYVNAGSGLSALKNGGDQIVITDSQGTVLDSLRYSPTWGGNGIALERKSFDVSGVFAENWGQSTAQLLGTPGSRNSVTIPQDAPSLEWVDFIDAETIRITFTKAIDQQNSADASKYSIGGGLSISSVALSGSREVTLSLTAGMSSGQSYVVSAENIADIFGNQSARLEQQLSYFLFENAVAGDIIINEFYHRPPAALRADGARPQYVELHNTSGKFINLQNWRIERSGGSGTPISSSSQVIRPDEYMVLSRDTTVFNQIFGTRNYVHVGGFPQYNLTTADVILIRDNEGNTKDSLRYVPTNWSREGLATERRSATAPTHVVDNWGISTDELGGTPGLSNSIGPDENPPSLQFADYFRADSIMIRFDKAINTETANDPEKFSITELDITEINVISETDITFKLSEDMVSGQTYTITVSDVEDLFGNTLEEDNIQLTYYLTQPVVPGDIVINEFMYNQPDGYTIYIELYNRSEKALDITGWQQANDTGTRRTLTNQRHIIPPDSFIVILPNTNLLEVFPDINYVNAGSGLSALKNGGDEIVITDSTGVVLDSLRYSPSWGGNGIAMERVSADVASVFRENWAESTAEFLGTPGRRNVVQPDTEAPRIQLLEYLAADSISINFTRSVDEASISVLENYSLSGGLSVAEIADFTGSSAFLVLDGQMSTAVDYNISLSNLVDPFGNALADTTIFFTYYEIAEANPGDIVINEFMFRPPSGYTRYVELYNSSQNAVSVAGWTINNDTGTRRIITNSRVVIPPDSFLVLLSSPDMREIFPDMNSVVISSMPANKTGGDDIVIRRADGTLLDSLSYLPAWGGSGVSLERISTDISAVFADNWANSPALKFGTPGSRNLVEPDTEAPQLLDVIAESPNLIRVIFSKVMEQQRAENTANYSISGRTISSVNWQRSQVFLNISPVLQPGQLLNLNISGLTDLFGNELAETSESFAIYVTAQAVERDIVINEFLYRPLDGEVTRFVELYNRSSKNVDINAWQIGRGTGNPVTITRGTTPDGAPLPVIVEPDNFIVITGNSDWLVDDTRAVVLSNFPALSSLGDAIFIRNDEGQMVDSLRYSNSWGNNEPGVSLERLDPNAASNDPTNWRSSPEGFSAGSQNRSFNPITEPPRIIFAGLTPEGNIRLRTNRFIELDENTEFRLGSTLLQVLSYNRHRGNEIILGFGQNSMIVSNDLTADEDEQITINNLKDFSGNVAASASIPLSRPVNEGDIVINEILYQPLAATENRSAQSEFVEFYNTRDFAISLEGFYIHGTPSADGSITRISPVSSQGAWIPARGYFVLHGDPASNFADTRIARFFELDENTGQFIIRANRNSLSFNTTADDIFLADSTGIVIDHVRYSSSWHNPNRVDVRGVSLERINPYSDSNNPDNWSSSTLEKGATPGVENTIFKIPSVFSESEGMVMEPNPFSPDGDGHEDNLFINYTLDEPDYLLRVRIYDRYGRLVKSLADGQVAGPQGSLIWDGLKDDGSPNRIGIYVVLFEAYNSATGRNRTFKETVVLARQL